MTIDSPTIELIDNWRHEAELAEPGLPTLFTMTKKTAKAHCHESRPVGRRSRAGGYEETVHE